MKELNYKYQIEINGESEDGEYERTWPLLFSTLEEAKQFAELLMNKDFADFNEKPVDIFSWQEKSYNHATYLTKDLISSFPKLSFIQDDSFQITYYSCIDTADLPDSLTYKINRVIILD